jgi:FMN reductase
MSGPSLVVVSGGLRQPSSARLLADRLAAASVDAVREAGLGEATVEVIELRDHARALVDHLLTGFPSPALQATMDGIRRADGAIVVSPIFNASYSGLFKLFFDVLEEDALAGVPVLLGATGGTARHSLALDHALRPLFAYLGALSLPTGVYASAEDWGGASDTDGDLAQRIRRAAGELAAAVGGHPRPAIADPFDAPPAFEDLLRTVADQSN